MSTFNQFQIGDFCQRTFAGLLNYPVQRKPTGAIDLLLNVPLSSTFGNIVQDTQKKRRYTITYGVKPCDEPSTVDICHYEGAGYTPTVSNIEYSFDGAPQISTRVITIGSQSFRDWCDLNGGGSGYLTLLQQQLVEEIAHAYERLDKAILQELYNRRGCYADGTSAEKTLQLFLNASSGAPTVNPAWSFPIEQDLAMLGLSTMSYYVGGGQFWQAKRVLQQAYAVPNTMFGVQPNSVPDNFAVTAQMSQITTSNTYEKIFVLSPEVLAITTYSNIAEQFANVPINPNSDLVPQLWNAMFNNTATTQAHSFVIVDPIKGLIWDVTTKMVQCGGTYELKFQATLTYKLHVLPMADRICGNDCFTGIQVYNLCPLPTAEPCDAPTPPDPVVSLCLTATLPDPCTYVLMKGETLTFTRGAFSLTWVAPIDYTITSANDLFIVLVSAFGSNATYGNWYINSCGDIAYNGLGADASGDVLAAGAGTISTPCFEAAITFTIAECEAC